MQLSNFNGWSASDPGVPPARIVAQPGGIKRVGQRDRVNIVRQLRINDEANEHHPLFIGGEALVLEAETVELFEIFRGLCRRDARHGLRDLLAAGQVAGNKACLVQAAGMDSHVVDDGPELPRRVFIDGRDKLEPDVAAPVHVFLDHNCGVVGPAAETGDLAKYVVQRHQQKAESKHCCRQQNQPQGKRPRFIVLFRRVRHRQPDQERNTPAAIKPR
ncbi:MAG: hypothetical protein U5K38_12135 [Woeseiaceae bacterium]|nr:hypothetical protein [Woeseiaceae bacterium]